MQDDHFDVFVIGAGQAGIPLALELARHGRQVALAERKDIGGSCVNFGCTPTKAAIASARVAHLARRAKEYGVTIPSVEVDFAAVLERARQIVQQSRSHLEQTILNQAHLHYFHAHARLLGKGRDGFRVRTDDREVTTSQVVLDTGTRSNMPPIEGLDDIACIDSDNWLGHTVLPRHLAIVGGGYIGLEMGQFYRRMGAEVTILQHGSQITEHEDADVAKALQELLEAEGIRFQLNAKARRLEQTPDGVRISIQMGAGTETIETSHVFLAVGRRPSTDDLGLETLGVKVDDKGIVEVDARLVTNVPGLWAAGDIRGGPMFTHTAWDDYRILKSQLLGDGSRTIRRIVPYAIFTDPALGRVGMTEDAARQAGRNLRVTHFDMARNGKAREIGESKGFIKVVIDADTRQILGAAVLAAEGAELVHLYVDVMNANAPYTAIEDAIHIHPTLAEALQSAVSHVT